MTTDRAYRTIKRDSDSLSKRAEIAVSVYRARIAEVLADAERQLAVDSLTRARAANRLARETITTLS